MSSFLCVIQISVKGDRVALEKRISILRKDHDALASSITLQSQEASQRESELQEHRSKVQELTSQLEVCIANLDLLKSTQSLQIRSIESGRDEHFFIRPWELKLGSVNAQGAQ